MDEKELLYNVNSWSYIPLKKYLAMGFWHFYLNFPQYLWITEYDTKVIFLIGYFKHNFKANVIYMRQMICFYSQEVCIKGVQGLITRFASKQIGLEYFIIKPAQSTRTWRAPARSVGFWRIKKIPYQAQSIQLGPRKCTFWKNAF